MIGQQRVIIERPFPSVDCGAFPVKRVVNETVVAGADIYCDGHDAIRAELHYRYKGESKWHTTALTHKVNDRWEAKFQVDRMGIYEFTLSAWVDHFESWHRDVLKKIAAGTVEHVDLLVGAELIGHCLASHPDMEAGTAEFLKRFGQKLTDKRKKVPGRAKLVPEEEFYLRMHAHPVRENLTRMPGELEIQVDRQRANFSSWYEVFPRSLGEKGKHGTFRDVINFLPHVAEMGFDVLYLPPIHPIGETYRKGKNNSTESEPGEPGSPWAIGNSRGGHKAIHPELGSLKDFRDLIRAAGGLGIDIAMDVAFQCSPDHPYVKDHPEWFRQRPDGSLQYAENPPKKYQDIYPLDFESDDWKNLWEELKSIFLYWIDQGITVFRVDNPHTKSIRFWGWVIEEIRREHPEVIFLSEAFTRPKVMYQLAKQGFSQSYTYFTWRNTKWELTSYLEELVAGEAVEFFRPNFWPNTPDILPEFLQLTNRAGFLQRLILAATLGSNYGIYGPAFELMEQEPVHPGKEEYANSEKYEIREWDPDQPRSLRKVIAHVNRIRKENPALQTFRSLQFHPVDNEALIAYSKLSDDRQNLILAVVNLDPHHTQSGWIHIPLEKFGLEEGHSYQVVDLLGGAMYMWQGSRNFVELNPGVMPAHIFRIRRKVRSEKDFDYFM